MKKSITASAVAPESRIITKVPQDIGKRLLVLAAEMAAYQEAMTHMTAVREALPATNAGLASQAWAVRENIARAYETARVEAFDIGWTAVTVQTGIKRGDLVEMTQRVRVGPLNLSSDNDYTIETERLEVQSLTLNGPAEAFHFSLQGVRLLKSGKPGKVPVQVPVQVGQRAMVLKAAPAAA